jgi:outer membrane receptor for ferric coprogen and ferric-rhodotorulic acid
MDSSGFIPQPVYGQEYLTRVGPMIDQPQFIFNFVLGWDYKGFSARGSFRKQDLTVQALDGLYSLFDSYYDTFTLIDVMLKQKITDNLSTFVNLTNIGNHVDDYYFKGEVKGKRLPTRSEYYGFRAQAGVKIQL